MGPKGAESSGFGAVGFTKNAQPLEEESTAGYVVKILRMWFLLRSYDGNLKANGCVEMGPRKTIHAITFYRALVYTYMYTYIHISIYIYVCMYIYIYVCIYIDIDITHRHKHRHTHIYIYININIDIDIDIYIYLYLIHIPKT